MRTLTLSLLVAVGSLACGSDGAGSVDGGAGGTDGGTDAGAGAVVEHPAFVTKATGSARLASWADAGGLVGLAAADAICGAAAARAGFTGDFVAWMSDAEDDAYCRVHGLAGKRRDDCGEATLPATAGPWDRADGHPFAGRIDRALSGVSPELYVPLRLDETGARYDGVFFTGTNATGEVSSDEHCGGWTDDSTDASAAAAVSWATGHYWSSSGTRADCAGDQLPIACFAVGAGPAMPLPQGEGHLAFVTSAEGTGDLASWPGAPAGTGVDAADSVCRAAASAAGFARADQFKAWLGAAPADRISWDGAWVRPDGVLVGSTQELLADAPRAPINVTEEGTYLRLGPVWIGDGCDGWGAGVAGQSGPTAVAAAANGGWQFTGSRPCSTPQHLYCLED